MAKRVPPLTAIQIAKLRPDPGKTIELVDGAVPGLRLRVTPAGTRSWSLNVRAKGVMRRFDVGCGLGLETARDTAAKLRQDIKAGGDPTAAKRAVRTRTMSATQGIGTLGSVIEAYFVDGPGVGLKTKAEQQRCIKFVFAAQLKRVALEISSAELQQAIDGHRAKVAAARATAYLAPVIRWAQKRALIAGSFDLDKPMADAPKQRVITPGELAALIPTFDDAYGRCCRFMLLTGVRRNEARNAAWGQFNLAAGTWTIPGDQRKDTRAQGRRRVKAKEDMAIPLSRQAMELLDEVCAAEQRRRQLEGDLREIGGDDIVFAGQRGGILGNWDRWLKANALKTGVSGWSAHALRRTTATLAGELGAPPHVVSVILGHTNVGGQLVAGYNKARYRLEHAEALQKLADYLDELAITAHCGITANSQGLVSNVVLLR